MFNFEPFATIETKALEYARQMIDESARLARATLDYTAQLVHECRRAFEAAQPQTKPKA